MLTQHSEKSRPRPLSSAPSRRKGQLKLKVWPSGDFSIGTVQPPKSDKEAHPLKGIYKDAFGIVFISRQAEPVPGLLTLAHWMQIFDFFVEKGAFDAASRTIAAADSALAPALPLGLSVPSNSPKGLAERKKRRGQNGITTNQKRLVKSAGAILEAGNEQSLISFLTCTLPSVSAEDLTLLAENWARLTKSFIKELSRELIRVGLPGEICGVTEIQEKRFERWGQVCPHLHLIFKGRKYWSDFWRISTAKVKDIWNHQVELILGHPFDGGATTRIEKPRKSLKRELGKYLTKGGKLVKSIIEAGKSHLLPTCWIVCSLSLRRRVKAGIRELRTLAVERLADNRSLLSSAGLLRYRDIVVDIDTNGSRRTITVGFAGYFCLDNWRMLLCDSTDELYSIAELYINDNDRKTNYA